MKWRLRILKYLAFVPLIVGVPLLFFGLVWQNWWQAIISLGMIVGARLWWAGGTYLERRSAVGTG